VADEADFRNSVNTRLTTMARIYHLSPTDVWAMSLDQWLYFVRDIDALVAATTT
jgi:hypothetical protein